MRVGAWVVGSWIAGVLVFAPAVARAGSYGMRARWSPSGDAGIAGYRIYIRPAGGALALALDAGLPAAGPDGTISAVVHGLRACTTYGFVVVPYGADGAPGTSSNEMTLAYATAAGLLDSDNDGLSNASEDRNLNCVVDAGETDPYRADTDGDGVGDARDLCQGTAAGAAVNAAGCSCAQVTCDDGNVCNGRESCVAGVCRPGTPLVCDDGNPCTADTCGASTGCSHAPIAGCASCSTAAQCDDGNACTADACVGGRCSHAVVADGSSCADLLFCNGAETCRSGVCTRGAPVGCDDGNACTADACDESQRRCVHVAAAGCCTSDAECTVSDACHTNARCDAGRCVTDTVVCPDPGLCAVASCDPHAGCQTTPLPDGTPCDDGNVCTVNDVCTAGTCGAAAAATPRLADGEASASVTRLSMLTTSRGISVSARAIFSLPAAIDPLADGEVQLRLRDDAGADLVDVTVPGALFSSTGPGRAVYRDDHRAEGGGYTRIDLRVHQDRASLVVRAAVPKAAPRTGESIDAYLTPSAPSATLDWRVRSRNSCSQGSGSCNGRARRCR